MEQWLNSHLESLKRLIAKAELGKGLSLRITVDTESYRLKNNIGSPIVISIRIVPPRAIMIVEESVDHSYSERFRNLFGEYMALMEREVAAETKEFYLSFAVLRDEEMVYHLELGRHESNVLPQPQGDLEGSNG